MQRSFKGGKQNSARMSTGDPYAGGTTPVRAPGATSTGTVDTPYAASPSSPQGFAGSPRSFSEGEAPMEGGGEYLAVDSPQKEGGHDDGEVDC
jgi:hypothetical protein